MEKTVAPGEVQICHIPISAQTLAQCGPKRAPINMPFPATVDKILILSFLRDEDMGSDYTRRRMFDYEHFDKRK